VNISIFSLFLFFEVEGNGKGIQEKGGKEIKILKG
jgi:hypothetical protein